MEIKSNVWETLNNSKLLKKKNKNKNTTAIKLNAGKATVKFWGKSV